MFEPSATPRVYGLPPGADFGRAVIEGLLDQLGPAEPDALARVEIIVNTRRLQRRLRDILDEGPARLHPQIRALGDLALEPVPGLPLPIPPLRRRLDLMRLVRRLIEAQPDLAPKVAAFDLAESLAALFEEMHGEGVDPATLAGIEVPDTSGHWRRSLTFVDLVADYLTAADALPDAEGRLRQVAAGLSRIWAEKPPDHPILLIGSTGSRGATSVMMEAIARLPQGAVILPGFDFDMPLTVWDGLRDMAGSEDHPQDRFSRFLARLDLSPSLVRPWTKTAAPNPARNRLLSLSLRPAPVTDQWQEQAPAMEPELETACAGLTMVTADSRREEADVIALRLRTALEDGKVAALISPDRLLTRQVTAALDRWGIVPDDSAGTPLHLSPPGRFLAHVLEAMEPPLTAELLLILLKHPLAATGAEDRGPHLRFTRELELSIRKKGIPYPTADTLHDWATEDERKEWAEWVAGIVTRIEAKTGQIGLEQRLNHHMQLAEAIAAGPGADGAGGLWDEAAGRAARAMMDDLLTHAAAAGEMDHGTYKTLVSRLLSAGEVRNRDSGHPNLRIWGTLEARVQSADLVILGSMNEGTWPETPAADPWLNRQMRQQAGLLMPERRIGLSAHDYQQAMAAKEVWITRSVRSDDAQTVPSRWVNRLTNLLGGLADGAYLKAIQQRGAAWVAAERLRAVPKQDIPREGRPSPQPPRAARPRQYSVTQIETLTRDPFAIYAKKVLGLSPLLPLQREPDALLRGILVHEVMEQFGARGLDPSDPATKEAFLTIARDVLAANCPWPTARSLWEGRIARIADWFLRTETERQALAQPHLFEANAEATIGDITLTGRADRVDLTPSGAAVIYDFKTGSPPSKKQQVAFNPQLLLLAAMAERGAFKQLGTVRTEAAAYIGLGSNPAEIAAPLADKPPDQSWAELDELMAHWLQDERGFTARIANQVDREERDYDHLSRLGEWDVSDDATPVRLI